MAIPRTLHAGLRSAVRRASASAAPTAAASCILALALPEPRGDSPPGQTKPLLPCPIRCGARQCLCTTWLLPCSTSNSIHRQCSTTPPSLKLCGLPGAVSPLRAVYAYCHLLVAARVPAARVPANIIPFVRLWYGQQSTYFWWDTDGQRRTIHQGEGWANTTPSLLQANSNAPASVSRPSST